MIFALALLVVPVSVESLLREMNDLDRLLYPATYRVAQASSYDRASTGPGKEWFANADAGKFVRKEGNEWVMADLKGPGAVVRIWSANPTGTIRFYFDGEPAPRLSAPMGDLLRGKVPPFGPPYGYEVSRGCNLYFPFPYAKSLKITAEGEVGGLYYHVGYRTYSEGTPVQSFRNVEALPPLPRSLDAPKPTLDVSSRHAFVLASGASHELGIPGRRVVRELAIKVSPNDGTTLRHLVLTMTVDGEKTIQAPLGDFFCTAAGTTPFESQPMSIDGDGTMRCRFPMPVGRRGRIEIENRGRNEAKVDVELKAQVVEEVPPLRFRAQWQHDRGWTRPMRDLNVLNTKGAGRLVGVFLHVENPTPAWWGEGDEKVYVDGEPFPSTFGTGTEDYFGYAWCRPDTFAHPYHGQSRCDGPGNFGHTLVYRWQTFDDIPYTRSLRFDLEMWHWAEVTATWARMAYWYATPDSSGGSPIRVRAPLRLEPPKPVAGAIEGEDLPVLAVTGGKHEVQSGFWEISGQRQRWWMDASPGDRLSLGIEVAKAGRYRIEANLCHARDYGIHEIRLNGRLLGRYDFYRDALGWKTLDLGVSDLPAGQAVLEVTCVGSHPNAVPRRMFGLDYVRLVPAR